MGNMTVSEDLVSEPMKDLAENQETVKPTMKSYRHKMQAAQARIRYREKLLKSFRQHQQKGTSPKRFKSLKPYPKMGTPDSQALVNAACQQAEDVVLNQMILQEEMKLKQDQSECQSLKEERPKVPRQPKMMTALQLQRELKELQAKYNNLCEKLESRYETLHFRDRRGTSFSVVTEIAPKTLRFYV